MLRVHKVADIINNAIVYCKNPLMKIADIAGLFTSVDQVNPPHEDFFWTMDIEIDTPPNNRFIKINLGCLISENSNLEIPIVLALRKLFYFESKLFASERPLITDLENEEVNLRIKKLHYEEAIEIANLKAEVANLEAASNYTKYGPIREAIPEDVKLLVWARDGGACMRCGNTTELQFDHVIPVAKGGSNTEANIQLLCKRCNLRKSDKIAFF